MASTEPTLFDLAVPQWELDAAGEQLAATIVFPEQPHGPYYYAVPAALASKLQAGQRVQVPLGKGNRLIVGYCTALAIRSVGSRPLKPVARLVDDQPLLSPAMLRLTQWMADYYLCPLGQVLQTVVPAGVRGRAGTREMTFLSVPDAIKQQLAAGELKLPTKQLDALRVLADSPRPLTPPEI